MSPIVYRRKKTHDTDFLKCHDKLKNLGEKIERNIIQIKMIEIPIKLVDFIFVQTQ